jgi:hypothetical protein
MMMFFLPFVHLFFEKNHHTPMYLVKYIEECLKESTVRLNVLPINVISFLGCLPLRLQNKTGKKNLVLT